MARVLEWPSQDHCHTVTNYSGAANGDAVDGSFNAKCSGKADVFGCIIVEDVATENPPDTLTGVSAGLVDFETALTAAAPQTEVFLDASGDFTTSAPAVPYRKIGTIVPDPDLATPTTNSTLVRIAPELREV